MILNAATTIQRPSEAGRVVVEVMQRLRKEDQAGQAPPFRRLSALDFSQAI